VAIPVIAHNIHELVVAKQVVHTTTSSFSLLQLLLIYVAHRLLQHCHVRVMLSTLRTERLQQAQIVTQS
jgi:hypothetical protein